MDKEKYHVFACGRNGDALGGMSEYCGYLTLNEADITARNINPLWMEFAFIGPDSELKVIALVDFTGDGNSVFYRKNEGAKEKSIADHFKATRI
jgi:hypothetical protein